jgi:hypothetical protein
MRLRVLHWQSAVLATACLLSTSEALADPSSAPSDEEVSRRLAFIETRLGRATPAASLWWSAWYFGYMAVSVGQAGVALGVTNRGLRIDSAVGAAFSSVGVLGMGVFDFPARHAAGTLAARPERTPLERRRKLAEGERLLAASARSEVAGRSWIAHVAGGALSLTSALVLALAYKRVVSSIVTVVSGMAITEAQIFTRPTAAIDDWRAYRQATFLGDASALDAAAKERVAPLRVVPHPGGLGLAFTF